MIQIDALQQYALAGVDFETNNPHVKLNKAGEWEVVGTGVVSVFTDSCDACRELDERALEYCLDMASSEGLDAFHIPEIEVMK